MTGFSMEELLSISGRGRHFLTYYVTVRVPTRPIRNFSTSSLSKALRLDPSARSNIAKNVQIFRTFLAKTLSPVRTISRYKEVFRL